MSSEKNLVLQASDISIVFGGLCAVSDASFDLYEDELIGLIGPNGAGKTTMFNMVSGIYTPTSGQLSYWDRENKVRVINKANPAQLNKLGIARTFQNIRLFGNLTVLDNVRIALHNSRISNPLDVLFRTSRFRRDEQIMTEKVMQLLSLFRLTTLQKLRVVILCTTCIRIPAGKCISRLCRFCRCCSSAVIVHSLRINGTSAVRIKRNCICIYRPLRIQGNAFCHCR